LPTSITSLAKHTASVTSISETGFRPWDIWWTRVQPINAAAGA
jgi:hypothetical protein